MKKNKGFIAPQDENCTDDNIDFSEVFEDVEFNPRKNYTYDEILSYFLSFKGTEDWEIVRNGIKEEIPELWSMIKDKLENK